MISSSRQLKDKVRNISNGNSNKATTLIRNFMMERFLESRRIKMERVSIRMFVILSQRSFVKITSLIVNAISRVQFVMDCTLIFI